MKVHGLLACLAAVFIAGTASAQAPIKMKIGYPPAVDYLPTLVAKENGCLAGKGIEAELTVIPVSTNIPAALVSGTLQVGASTAPTLLPAIANGLDLIAIAGSSRLVKGNEGLSVVAQPDLVVTGAGDFVGKKVGVPGIMSVADLVFRKWLKNNGVDPAAVTFVEMPFPRMMEMMKSKTVDAVVATEPARSAIVDNGAGKRAPFEYHSEVVDNSLLTFWMATGQWAKDNPKAIADFRVCVAESIDWIKANREKAEGIQLKYLKVLTKTSPDWTADIAPADFKLYVDISREFGLISDDIPLEAIVYRP